jgi:hypothetical protein
MKRLITINSYRGQRILLALPCRGQRTRTNASTVKRQLGKMVTIENQYVNSVSQCLAHCLAFKFFGTFALIQRTKGIQWAKGRSLIGKMSLSKPRYRIVPVVLALTAYASEPELQEITLVFLSCAHLIYAKQPFKI